jgi:hypothetical protein
LYKITETHTLYLQTTNPLPPNSQTAFAENQCSLHENFYLVNNFAWWWLTELKPKHVALKLYNNVSQNVDVNDGLKRFLWDNSCWLLIKLRRKPIPACKSCIQLLSVSPLSRIHFMLCSLWRHIRRHHPFIVPPFTLCPYHLSCASQSKPITEFLINPTRTLPTEGHQYLPSTHGEEVWRSGGIARHTLISTLDWSERFNFTHPLGGM